jgi:acetyl-CoA carboxylase biotin carboxyl carrier protein
MAIGRRSGGSSQEETESAVAMSTDRSRASIVPAGGAPRHRHAVGTSGPRFRPAVGTPCTRPPARLWCAPPSPLQQEEDPVPNIEAHITGTVWKIECQVGDQVAEGDTVVILESMKMEMPVEAEDEGTVKEILCEEGQAVNEGDTLVVLA